jgi:hypothetical protein
VGGVAALRDADLLIAFRVVAGDSRCPVDVTCVWAGDAEVRIGTARDGGPWSWHSLHTGIEPRSVTVGDVTVTLTGLDPDTRAEVAIEPGDYVAGLTATTR